jgi:hypothetical protein
MSAPATFIGLPNLSTGTKSRSASLVAVRGVPRDNFFAAFGNSQRWGETDLFLHGVRIEPDRKTVG